MGIMEKDLRPIADDNGDGVGNGDGDGDGDDTTGGRISKVYHYFVLALVILVDLGRTITQVSCVCHTDLPCLCPHAAGDRGSDSQLAGHAGDGWVLRPDSERSGKAEATRHQVRAWVPPDARARLRFLCEHVCHV